MMTARSLPVKLASAVILASHRVPQFRPRPSYSSVAKKSDAAAKFRFEFDDSTNFLENVPHIDVPALVNGKLVLDFGSGYGGRTAWLARWAREIVGIEIFESMLREAERCTAGLPNCRFVLGEEEAIRFPNDTFDVIVTFDVLEHVQRPDIILREWYRVLKPGGTALIVFTPYEGAFSHHLNYVSLLPGLQWLFEPDTLMTAIRQLACGPLRNHIDIKQIPSAHLSYDGDRHVLPTLNGLTKPQFMRHVRECAFDVRSVTSRPILEKFRIAGNAGALINSALCRIPGLDARLAHNLTAVLTKARSAHN